MWCCAKRQSSSCSSNCRTVEGAAVVPVAAVKTHSKSSIGGGSGSSSSSSRNSSYGESSTRGSGSGSARVCECTCTRTGIHIQTGCGHCSMILRDDGIDIINNN